jgi:hypothetical protein
MITFDNADNLKQYILDQLKATDYAMLSDVNISNKDEFIGYRSFLRQALKDLYLSTYFPEEPQPIWKTLNTPTTTGTTETTGTTTL